MRFLVWSAFVFATVGTLLDNYSTYHALTVFANDTFEVNPVGRWIFSTAGLEHGLVINTAVAVGFFGCIASGLFFKKSSSQLFVLAGIGIVRIGAAINNFTIISALTAIGGS